MLFRRDVIFMREPLKNVNLILISFLLFSDCLTGFNLVWATPKNFRKNCWKSKFSSCLKSHLRIPKVFWFFGIWNWESYHNHWNVEDACPFFCRRHDNPLLCLKPPVSAAVFDLDCSYLKLENKGHKVNFKYISVISIFFS